MADYTAPLDAAIASLETAVAAHEAALNVFEAVVDPTLVTRVGALEGGAATMQTQVDAQHGAADALAAQVTAQAATIAANLTAITDLTARLVVVENRTNPPQPSTDPAVTFTVDLDTVTAPPLVLNATITATNCDHWQVDWQGGTTVGIVHAATDTKVAHTYDQPGTYVATVRAWRDSDSKQATAEHTFVVPPPATSGTVGQSFGGYGSPIGAYQTRTYNDNEAAKAAAAGFSWFRCDLTVAMVAPTATTRNWQAAWNWIDAYAAKDIKVMANLYILPQWMNGSSNDKTQPTTDAVYANFCAEAAPLLYQHGVRAVELWNEQNWGFWAPTPDRARYVSMAKAAALAIKAAEPRMLVISGGVSTADTEYNNGTHKTVTRYDTGASYTSTELGAHQSVDIYGALGLWAQKTPGGAQAIDGCGIHPYLDGVDPGVDTTDPNWMAWQQTPMRRTISLLDKWGGAGVKVWNTESACPRTKADGTVNVSEAVQATRAANAYKAFNAWTLADGSKMRNRLGPYFYFTYADWSSSSESPRARSFGIVSAAYVDHLARPAVSAVLASALV